MGTKAPEPGCARPRKGANLPQTRRPARSALPSRVPHPRVPGPARESSSLLQRSAGPNPTMPTELHAAPLRSERAAPMGPAAQRSAPRSLPPPTALRGCVPLWITLPFPSPHLSPPPQPPASGQPRAGWAGRAGGGAQSRAAPAQKAESQGAGARAVRAGQTSRRREPAGTWPEELRCPPGPPRPRAMEFLWAPLLGLCCSLAAADRHTVFWNSSNPK